MNKIKISLLIPFILLNAIFSSGCWNYKEVDKMVIVAGVAIDKGDKEKFKMTVEVINISSDKDTKMKSKIISTEGKTMFDAARNMISLSGRRLYWGHSKLIVISKDLASDGIVEVIDWYNRDTETREDIHLIISKERTAKEIFEAQESTEEIKSLVLDQMIDNEESLSKAPLIDLLLFDIQIQTKGISQAIPSISLLKSDGTVVPHIIGTAIIKNNKLLGFLDGEETKNMLFIKDEIKGGVLTEELQLKGKPTTVSLEIFKSKTKIKPIVKGKDIKINVDIEITVAINELGGEENLIDEPGRIKLEEFASKALKKQIETLIKKVQSEYGADIFGFGAKLMEDKNKVWDGVGNNWGGIFKDLDVNVNTKVHIKNSAILSKPFKVGD